MITLFHPEIPQDALDEVAKVLATSWLGQGPVVDRLEREFATQTIETTPVAVSSATAGLHLAYILAGIGVGDEVITPVFTCVATNMPLLQLGAKIVFADINPATLSVDPQSVELLVTKKTKAIVAVYYGGEAACLDQLRRIADAHGLALIADAAQAMGGTLQGRHLADWADFTVFSFQATKHVTSGDGGMLCVRDPVLAEKARRLRWFGIERATWQRCARDVDITEIGYKYHMNDIAAALVLGGLVQLPRILERRRALYTRYLGGLQGINGLKIAGRLSPQDGHAAWVCTVLVVRREVLVSTLRVAGIESGYLHYRNDRYSIFAGSRRPLPGMDACENSYLALPLHQRLSEEEVDRVCAIIREGW